MGNSTGISRREWLATCAALGAGTTLRAAGGTFQSYELNHVALRVTNLERSRDFYRKHLGAPGIIFEKPGQAYLRVGSNFVALFERGEAGLDHFAISVKGYEPDAVEARCRDMGLETRRSSSFVYIHDPDGIEVQIAHVEHEVHSPVVRAAPETSTFRGVGMNHIALRVTDVARSRDFYRKVFGLPVARETLSNCFLGLGKNFLALFKGDTGGMDHYCFEVANYEVEAVTAELDRQGLRPRHPSGTDRVYFKDPDGLTVQLAGSGHQP